MGGGEEFFIHEILIGVWIVLIDDYVDSLFNTMQICSRDKLNETHNGLLIVELVLKIKK